MRAVTLFFALFAVARSAFGDHLPGGSITYQCLGGNSYEVVLTLFRDCSGAPLQPQQLDFSNDCGVSFTATGLLPASIKDASPLCDAQLVNSACQGGGLAGIEVYTYRHTLFLSPCNSWTVAWSACCRQASLNLTDASGLYIEARFNSAGGICASSPQFTEDRVPFVCVGQAVIFNAGAMPVGNVLLRHRFVDARFAAPLPTPVTYVLPHYGGQPYTGMVLDSLTGRITFTPNLQGRITVVVRVDQYDAEGVWLGSVLRDFTFVVTACSNTVPLASSGTLNAVVGNGVLTGSRTAQVCAGGSVCLQTFFSDPDPGQSLTVTLNAPAVLPGAVMQTTGSNPVTASVCWDPLNALPGDRYFTITVSDNACPVQGYQTYTYLLKVAQPPNVGTDGIARTCRLADPFTLIDSLGGAPPPDGFWTAPGGGTHNGVFMPASDPPGLYTYTVTGFPNCVARAVVDVTFLPDETPHCVLMDVRSIGTAPLRLFPNPASSGFSFQGLPARDGHLFATLLDAQGRTVWEVRPQAVGGAGRIEVPVSITAGGYVLLLTARNGEVLARARVSIER